MHLETPTVLVDEDCAKKLGLQLNAARLERGLAVEDLADALLFSKAQIVGLESADFSKFYSNRLYAQQARKYCEYIGVMFPEDELLDESRLVGGIDAGAAQPKTGFKVSPGIAKKIVLSLRVAIGGVLAALVAVVVLFKLTDQNELTSVNVPPPEEARAAVEATAPTAKPEADKPDSAAMPAITPEKPAASAPVVSGSGITIGLTGPSWVHVSYKDGRQIQKNYKKGDSVTVDTAGVQAIVIGNSDAVDMTVNGREVDLAPYRKANSNVARIVGQELRSLIGQERT